MIVFDSVDALAEAADTDLGSTEWQRIEQTEVDRFADLTGDHNWVHVDTERAKRESPFGTTIVHGAFTLALCTSYVAQLMQVRGTSLVLNYGMDGSRLRAPVPVGSRIRASAKLAETVRLGAAVQARVRVTVSVEGQSRPACQADQVVVCYP